MTQLLEDRTQVSDLRGSGLSGPSTAVLEDPSGRRGRRLRLLGRLVAALLTVWLVALVLGAVGINPIGAVPFGTALRPASAPPAQTTLPTPAQPDASDLVPARPASPSA